MKKSRLVAPETWILAGILLLGIGLRLAGVGWGIPLGIAIELTIPVPVAAGQYWFKVGWYDALSGQRLAVGQDNSVTLLSPVIVGL